MLDRLDISQSTEQISEPYSDRWSQRCSNLPTDDSVSETSNELAYMMLTIDMADSQISVLRKLPDKRRGRPTDAVSHRGKKMPKNEEKDKYWLRIFRAYMKIDYPNFRRNIPFRERSFWDWFLSPNAEPKKRGEFPSYNAAYKRRLFSMPSYQMRFNLWFYRYGEAELQKKYEENAVMRAHFWDYAEKELVHYVDEDMESRPESPLTVSNECRGVEGQDVTDFCLDEVDSMLVDSESS